MDGSSSYCHITCNTWSPPLESNQVRFVYQTNAQPESMEGWIPVLAGNKWSLRPASNGRLSFTKAPTCQLIDRGLRAGRSMTRAKLERPAGNPPAYTGLEDQRLSFRPRPLESTTSRMSKSWSGISELNRGSHRPKRCGFPLSQSP